MKIKLILASLAALAAGAILLSGQDKIGGEIVKQKGNFKMAVIDFRGAGDAQKFMTTFNTTLWDELNNSGALEMVGKTFLPPLEVPQQPQDFKPPTTAAPLRRGDPPRTVKNGPWLTDWSGPPTNANFLTFGYTAVQDVAIALARVPFQRSASPRCCKRWVDRQGIVLRITGRRRRQESRARIRRRHFATVRTEESFGHQDLLYFRTGPVTRKSGLWITTGPIRSR